MLSGVGKTGDNEESAQPSKHCVALPSINTFHTVPLFLCVVRAEVWLVAFFKVIRVVDRQCMLHEAQALNAYSKVFVFVERAGHAS